MKWWKRWTRRGRVEAEMQEEMEFHRDSRAADLVRRGLSEAEARRQARLEFGSMESYREECRTELGYRPWDELWGDLRYGWRCLMGSPGYSGAAIAILAVAIGVNAAFFTLYSNYVLKPLPIRAVERHFYATTADRTGRGAGGFSSAEMAVLAEGTRGVVEGLYGAGTYQLVVLEPVQREGMVSAVSAEYFELLGARPVLGNVFRKPQEGEAVVVLSEVGRRRFFGGEGNPIGKQVRIRATLYRVIGLMPPEFGGTEAVVPDFWVGMGMQGKLRGERTEEVARTSLYGYLKPGASMEQAKEALTAVAARLPRGEQEPIAQVTVKPMQSLIPELEESAAASGLVFAAFLMVLLIACANLTNLSLSRAAARTHEIGMRLSLGASRGRIVRQLLTESVLTAVLGAGLGLLLALVSVQVLQDTVAGMSGVGGVTMQAVKADWRVMFYSCVLGVVAGLTFGMLPAIEISSPNLTQSTKREQSSFGGRVRPRRMRNLLIGGQVAASLVLLILGGVLVRNIQRLDSVEAGYDLERIYDLKLNQPSGAILQLIGEQSGVKAVTAVGRVPLYGWLSQMDVVVGGRQERVAFNHVDEKYFEVMGMVVEGRGFHVNETGGQAGVVVVSQATARKLWPGIVAVGQNFKIAEGKPAGTFSVVGVVPDVVSGWMFQGADPTMVYFPARAGQEEVGSAMARIEGNGVEVQRALQALCLGTAEGTGCQPTRLREVSAMQRFPLKVAAMVAGVLGMLALMLTGVGLYGVASYSVVQRRREIGIQLALGALPRQVMGRILGEAGWCVAGGLAVGMPVCLGLSALAAASMFELRTFDGWAYMGVPLLLAGVALLACAVPARRASRLDPMQALREE